MATAVAKARAGKTESVPVSGAMSDGVSDCEAMPVDRASLPSLQPLMEEYVAGGAGNWSVRLLTQTAWMWAIDPHVGLWVLVRRGESEPLGFLAVQMRAGYTGREGGVLAAYVCPGLSPAGVRPLLEALWGWAGALGITRLMVRTNVGSKNGMADPATWEGVGFVSECTIHVATVGRQLGDGGNGERGTDPNNLV